MYIAGYCINFTFNIGLLVNTSKEPVCPWVELILKIIIILLIIFLGFIKSKQIFLGFIKSKQTIK